MKKTILLAMLLIPVFGSSCSILYANKLVITDKGDVEQNCKMIGFSALVKPPPSLKLQNVCVQGVVYGDREYVYIKVRGDNSENDADVGIFPDLSSRDRLRLRLVTGKTVTVVGDLSYSEKCWQSSEARTVCAPLRRPLYLEKGMVIVARGQIEH